MNKDESIDESSRCNKVQPSKSDENFFNKIRDIVFFGGCPSSNPCLIRRFYLYTNDSNEITLKSTTLPFSQIIRQACRRLTSATRLTTPSPFRDRGWKTTQGFKLL